MAACTPVDKHFNTKPKTQWFVCLIEGQPLYGVKYRSASGPLSTPVLQEDFGNQ